MITPFIVVRCFPPGVSALGRAVAARAFLRAGRAGNAGRGLHAPRHVLEQGIEREINSSCIPPQAAFISPFPASCLKMKARKWMLQLLAAEVKSLLTQSCPHSKANQKNQTLIYH
jgi:hypothetical protein